MKKIVTGLFCTFALVASAATNAGIKLGVGVDQGFGVTAQIDDTVNLMIGNDGIAGDYLFRRGSFDSGTPFTWYVGAGLFAGWDHGVGVRLPLGLDLNFANRWDGYVQVSPQVDFDKPHDNVDFGVDAALGIRYAF